MKKLLIASLLFNFLIALFFVGKRYYYAHSQSTTINDDAFEKWNNMRNSLYAIHAVDSNDIVFIGNSLTEAFPVTEFFGSDCKNRGIGGNKTSHILLRIEGIAKRQPRKLFIEAGINDLVFGGTVDATFKNYVQIVSTVINKSPRTQVYVQSTMPTCRSYEPFNRSVKELNASLLDYCQRAGVTYIDIYSKMAHGNKMDSTLTEDGLHLNGAGYEIWRNSIKGYVQ